MKNLISIVILALGTTSLLAITGQEQEDIDRRLKAFYQIPPDPSVMSQSSSKFGLQSQSFVHPHPELRLKDQRTVHSALEASAQVKSTEKFQTYYCNSFLKKHFPGIQCGEPKADRASIQVTQNIDDSVQSLLDSWVNTVQDDLDKIPVEGKTGIVPWSDDYWRTRWGLTSFRYAAYDPFHEFKTYQEAVDSYKQPSDWKTALSLPLPQLEAKVLDWSPSEKYDLTVGDDSFSLTTEQKEEGQDSIGDDGNVEDWMGICHGWAPAAIMVSRPLKPTKLIGTNGKVVEWYPPDIKALATLAWANGTYNSNFTGGRCDAKNPKTFPNGRLSDQECFDNNPATFHLVLGNMIGIAKQGFVFDKTFDYEVWNQPVTSYELTYFNPLDTSKRDKDWKKVAVVYDDAFKKIDRFQKPLTRGHATETHHSGNGDENIKKVVGVIASVVYASEHSPPKHIPGVEPDELLRDSYTYDLELEEKNGKWVPTGGEWHSNLHPDFMWVPRNGEVSTETFDSTQISFTGDTAPAANVTHLAKQASAEAYPLCKVLKELIKRSTGEDTYVCN